MSFSISPVGLSGAPVANQLSVLLSFREKLCKPVCVANNTQPDATVKYEVGTPTLEGTTVFVPITASIQIVSPSGCCQAITQVCTERFTVAFQGNTTLPTTTPVITSVGTSQGISCVSNGVARCYTINDSVTISIGAASSAS